MACYLFTAVFGTNFWETPVRKQSQDVTELNLTSYSTSLPGVMLFYRVCDFVCRELAPPGQKYVWIFLIFLSSWVVILFGFVFLSEFPSCTPPSPVV